MKNSESKFIVYKKQILEKGITSFILNRINKIFDSVLFLLIILFKKEQIFIFKKKKFRYSLSRYNYTWKNERTVEIPLIYDFLIKNKNKNILEVGNVLSHYYKVSHDIVDKYEKSSNVINKDIIDFKPKIKYDLIIAISTLEHVGWEEVPREPRKIIKTLHHLRSLLKKNGKLIVTLPIGYTNPFLNKQINSNKLGFSQVYFLKRYSVLNHWKQVEFNEIKDITYNTPYPNANAILVGIIE